VVLHSFFMASWCNIGSTVGPTGPNSRTLLRKLQRKHTQHCYEQMKNRLLSIVKPIPSTALHADRLETFRANLYSASDETSSPTDQITSPPTLHACNWCGTWMPIPMQAIITTIDTQAATAAETLENSCTDKGLIKNTLSLCLHRSSFIVSLWTYMSKEHRQGDQLLPNRTWQKRGITMARLISSSTRNMCR